MIAFLGDVNVDLGIWMQDSIIPSDTEDSDPSIPSMSNETGGWFS